MANSLKTKRQLFTSYEAYEMATNKDDSFPRLLREVVMLRQSVLQQSSLVKPFMLQYATPLKTRLAALSSTPLAPIIARPMDQEDWLRAFFRASDALCLPSVRLYAFTSTVAASTLPWLYDLFTIPHVVFFYQQLFAFCEKHYKRERQDPSFIFLFIDVVDSMLHSAQVVPSALQASFTQQILALVEEIVGTVVDAVEEAWKTLMEGGTEAAALQALDTERLEQCGELLETYRRIELGSTTVLWACRETVTRRPEERLADSLVARFVSVLQDYLQESSRSPCAVMASVRQFHSSLQLVASCVKGVSSPVIVSFAVRTDV